MPACSGATMSIAPIAIPLSTISAAVLDAFLVEIGWLPCASGQVSLQACGMSLTSTPCVPLELGSLASSLARTRTDRAHPDAALTKAPRRSDVATLFSFSYCSLLREWCLPLLLPPFFSPSSPLSSLCLPSLGWASAGRHTSFLFSILPLSLRALVWRGSLAKIVMS